MIRIRVDNNSAKVISPELLTSGSIGAKVTFSFSSEWAELSKTAVFTNGKKTIDVIENAWDGTSCVIPHECLSVPFAVLKIGVYGINSDGTLAIPTAYADCGTIHLGADPTGDESADPTLPVWEQIKTPDLSGYYTKSETDELLKYAGRVKSVNGALPDENGNVTLDVYYTKAETDALLGDVTALINAL